MNLDMYGSRMVPGKKKDIYESRIGPGKKNILSGGCHLIYLAAAT